MSASFDLAGPVAVVTGVSRGIGRAIAAALARAGAHVAGVFLGDDADAGPVRADVEGAGREHAIFPADAGDPASHRRLVEVAVERWGSVDVWVNNAAALLVKPLVETTDDDWHGLMAANLHGYFYGCREAARVMYPQGRGRIVNVTSAADIQAIADLGAYIAAKGAIVGLTKTLALEAGAHGVTVNAVAPGAVDTELNKEAYTPEVRATYERRIPLGRIGSEDEIAAAVVFLASTAARYVTGHELVVDGGLVVNGSVGHARSGQ